MDENIQNIWRAGSWTPCGLVSTGHCLEYSRGFALLQFLFCTTLVARTLRFLPLQAVSFLIGFLVGMMALMAICFLFTAANILYTNVFVRLRVARRMVGMIEGWSELEAVLDVGCGRGLLLNTVALRLKKEGSGGRVVGVDLWLNSKSGKSMASTLQTSRLEQTQEYVTCKSGDARNLPFPDEYFDAVVSALCLNNLGQDYGKSTSAAANERFKGLQEIIRVLKPGAEAVVWDIMYGPEYEVKLRDLGMDSVSLSNCISAFMLPSHIVKFKKPVIR